MLVTILVGFGVGVVSSIVGNYIYDRYIKRQYGKPAEIEVVLDQASKNSLSVVVLTLEGVFVLVKNSCS